MAQLTLNESDSVLFKEALVSLATDSGLHPLVPYFTCFIADEVTIIFFLSWWIKMEVLPCASSLQLCTSPFFQVSRGLNNFPLLFALMRVVNSLLQNPHIHVEPYVSSPLIYLVYLYIYR